MEEFLALIRAWLEDNWGITNEEPAGTFRIEFDGGAIHTTLWTEYGLAYWVGTVHPDGQSASRYIKHGE